MMWMKYASCRGLPVDQFMPKRGEMVKIKEAKKICAECPVLMACRNYSIATAQEVDLDGLFGGWTKNERQRNMRSMGLTVRRMGYTNLPMPKIQRRAAFSHGTASAYRKHLADNELPCADCYHGQEARLYRQATQQRKVKYG